MQSMETKIPARLALFCFIAVFALGAAGCHPPRDNHARPDPPRQAHKEPPAPHPAPAPARPQAPAPDHTPQRQDHKQPGVPGQQPHDNRTGQPGGFGNPPGNPLPGNPTDAPRR